MRFGFDVQLLPATKVSRRITLRLDRCGVYLLGWADPYSIASAVSFQWPRWAQEDNERGQVHVKPGFSLDSWLPRTWPVDQWGMAEGGYQEAIDY